MDAELLLDVPLFMALITTWAEYNHVEVIGLQ